MNLITRIAVPALQLPVGGFSVTELRAKAVQQINAEPVESTPKAIENGADNVKTQPVEGA